MDPNLKQKLLIDPPASLEAAVQYCERYVAALLAVEGSRRPFHKIEKVRMVRPCDEEEEGEDDELVEEVVNLIKSKRYSTRDLSDTKCYNCGMMGHLRRQCTAKCETCGGTGHNAKECPSPLNGEKPFSEARRGAEKPLASQTFPTNG